MPMKPPIKFEVRRGEQQVNAKLNDEAVREIRRIYDAASLDPPRKQVIALAARFGVAPAQISRVGTRKGWRHVKDLE